MPKSKDKSALKVQKGIEQPSSINPDAVEKYKSIKQNLQAVREYVDGILAGEIGIMSKAITIVESSLSGHQKIGREIIRSCLPHSGKSLRIGITGVPGAGKSTFIEAFGKHLTSLGKKVAVLAIDPSSQRTKGSILGDKTRMEELANDKNAFIRPSPAA
ncbi:MAG: ATP/GTP-binding protein, partial [Bacteroidales bacterium]|nr:ATP/GTP-binding protein [Bacteroidales bacterium]